MQSKWKHLELQILFNRVDVYIGVRGMLAMAILDIAVDFIKYPFVNTKAV